MKGVTEEEELAAHRHPMWGFAPNRESDPAYIKLLAAELASGEVEGPISFPPGTDFTRDTAVMEQAARDGFHPDRPQEENDVIAWLAAEKVHNVRVANGTEYPVADNG